MRELSTLEINHVSGALGAEAIAFFLIGAVVTAAVFFAATTSYGYYDVIYYDTNDFYSPYYSEEVIF
jgi:hypothetical protein